MASSPRSQAAGELVAAPEPPAVLAPPAAAATPREQQKQDEEVQAWDVALGPRKEGVQRWGMIVPTMIRLAASCVGGAGAVAGYALGKCGEKLGGGKAVDSSSFRAGFSAWMWSNGIFPEVEYEPLPAELAARLQRRHGLPAPPGPEDGPLAPLLVSNHVSVLDGLVLASTFSAPKVVAMAKCRHLPLLGAVMQDMGSVFVDPRQPDSRQATAEAIRGHCDTWAPGDRPMLIFPEGTMTNGHDVVDFRKGAFLAGTPVRPLVVVYTGHFDPANTTYKMTDQGPRRLGAAEWARQFYGHYIHSVHIRVLPPYLPSDEERQQPELYAKNCQDYISRELARVHEELHERSWKRAAGRERGGLGYQLGDETAAASRSLLSFFGCAGPRAK